MIMQYTLSMAPGISKSWAYILWMQKWWQGEIHTCIHCSYHFLGSIISVSTDPIFFTLTFSSYGRGSHTVLHGLLVTLVSNSPVPLPWDLSPPELCSWRELGTVLAVRHPCWHPRWEPVGKGRNGNAKKVPLTYSEISLGVSWVGRVWAWQRFVHWGRRQIVTQRKGLQSCLWAPTKPKRSYEISGSAFERSWQPLLY